jgi:hypothetical protein
MKQPRSPEDERNERRDTTPDRRKVRRGGRRATDLREPKWFGPKRRVSENK